jgi:short-subunit dehydrogenase
MKIEGCTGDVTLVVNNAGVASSANVLTATQAALDTDFRTNVYGTLAVIKAFVPVSSVLAGARRSSTCCRSLRSGASQTMGGYSASKAAAYSITQSLRPELKGKHIEILVALSLVAASAPCRFSSAARPYRAMSRYKHRDRVSREERRGEAPTMSAMASPCKMRPATITRG